MKIRKLLENKEIVYPDDGGEVVKCPVCHAVWMEDDEHVTDPDCPHLRFVYCTYGDPDFVAFAGSWDMEQFENQFLSLVKAGDGIDEIAAFKKLNNPSVDEVVYHDWNDDPIVQWSTYWGYKTDKSVHDRRDEVQDFVSGGTETTAIGYINRNQQQCGGHRGVRGNDHGQFSYRMECLKPGCGHIYGANGSDVFQRRCPNCQGGTDGISY
jgi:hypothetical protein